MQEDREYHIPEHTRADIALWTIRNMEYVMWIKRGSPDPTDVGVMGTLPDLDASLWFGMTIRVAMPLVRGLDAWYDGIPSMTESADQDAVRRYLAQPMMDCDWRSFIEALKCVVAEWYQFWSESGYRNRPDIYFERDVNGFFEHGGLPWKLDFGQVRLRRPGELVP